MQSLECPKSTVLRQDYEDWKWCGDLGEVDGWCYHCCLLKKYHWQRLRYR